MVENSAVPQLLAAARLVIRLHNGRAVLCLGAGRAHAAGAPGATRATAQARRRLRRAALLECHLNITTDHAAAPGAAKLEDDGVSHRHSLVTGSRRGSLL